MNRLIRCASILVGGLAFSSLALAQYQMVITGDSYGSIGPYTGSIYTGGAVSGNTVVGGTPVFSGPIICDDTATDIGVPYAWNAKGFTVPQAASGGLYTGESYTIGSTTYTTLQMYEAAAYLASELLNNPGNSDLQDGIWNIMNLNTNPATQTTAETTDISNAFAAVVGGYTGQGWSVFTPVPGTASQEFFVYTPEPVAAAILGINVLTGLGLLLFRRRRAV